MFIYDTIWKALNVLFTQHLDLKLLYACYQRNSLKYNVLYCVDKRLFLGSQDEMREFEHTNTENSTSLIYFRHYKYNQTTGLGGRQGVVEKNRSQNQSHGYICGNSQQYTLYGSKLSIFL